MRVPTRGRGRLLVSLSLLAGLSGGTNQAHAAGALVLNGEMQINCHGCGGTSARLSGSALGVVGLGAVNGPFTSVFDFFSPPGVTCLLTARTFGEISLPDGSWLWLEWTMLGNVTIISTGGAVNGGGVGTFAVTRPLGIPCGGPATASFTATLAGI